MLRATKATFLIAALNFVISAPALADGALLDGRSLSLDIGEPLLLGLAGDPTMGGDPASLQGVSPYAPMMLKDRARAHRGSVMTAFGVPVMAAGVGALIWAGAASSTNDCGQPRSRGPYAYGGLATTTLGVGFSTAGIVALRRASKETRQAKTRRTRVATGVSAAFGTVVGALALYAIGIAGGFCSS